MDAHAREKQGFIKLPLKYYRVEKKKRSCVVEWDWIRPRWALTTLGKHRGERSVWELITNNKRLHFVYRSRGKLYPKQSHIASFPLQWTACVWCFSWKSRKSELSADSGITVALSQTAEAPKNPHHYLLTSRICLQNFNLIRLTGFKHCKQARVNPDIFK